MSFMVGIISYLPDNELRTQRLAASRIQIEWLHNLFKNIKIMSVCQNYKDEDCSFDYVDYIKFESGIGAGAARNVILKHFYKSDYDWLFMLDDDTIFYPYYNYENFLLDILENPKKFCMIDAVSALEPEYHPFKKLNYADKNNLTHYKFEPRELNSGSATSILKNIKKFNNEELYFPNVDASSGEGREDMEFLFSWLKRGFSWYTMDTLVRKSLCFDKSSIFGKDVEARNKILMTCLDNICVRYKDDGLQRETNGKITWKRFNDMYNASIKVLYVPRIEPITFEDNVIPKEKNNSKKLF